MSEKKGGTRKRRRQRLPTSGGSWDDEFEPSAHDWARIEAGYRVEFSPTDRSELIEIVRSHLMWEPYERHAPFVDDARNWLDRIADATRRFHNDLIQVPSGEKAREASWTSESLIERNFRTHLFPEEGKFRRFIFLVGDFLAACKLAQKEFPDATSHGFVEGQTWNLFIRNLTKFAEDRNMPTAASKGANKSKSGAPSPFVAFVRELQRTFRQDSRRHDHSDAALAAGITLARRRPDTGR